MSIFDKKNNVIPLRWRLSVFAVIALLIILASVYVWQRQSAGRSLLGSQAQAKTESDTNHQTESTTDQSKVGNNQKNITSTDSAPPALVRVMTLQKSGQYQTLSFPGVAKEAQAANLSFRVAGPITEIDVKVGQHIKKGEVVAKIDDRDYQLGVQRTEAELAAANAALSAMVTGARSEDIASLEAALKAAESQAAQAKTNFERFESLLKDGAVTQAQYDGVKTLHDVANAQVESAVQQLEKAKTGARKEEIDATKAKIDALNAMLTGAKNALADTSLQAPFDGFIIEKYIDKHELIAPGFPVISFADTQRIDINASLPEDVIVREHDMIEFSCSFEAYPNKIFQAELKEIGHAIQRGKQTYPLALHVEIPENEEASIFPGMVATVYIKMKREVQPLQVPTAALVADQKNNSARLWVIDPATGTVKSRQVNIVRLLNDGTEITGEIRDGEQIVIAGARFLSEGQKVKVEE